MPKIYVGATPKMIAYVIDGGDSNYSYIPDNCTDIEAEYMAVMYGLSEFFVRWQKELDARQYDGLEDNLAKVPEPSRHTPRLLPPPIAVCLSSEIVVRHLRRKDAPCQFGKLAQQVWQMTKNVDVTFLWIPRRENLAGKMLK